MEKRYKVMCRESSFTSRGLLQFFLSLYTQGKKKNISPLPLSSRTITRLGKRLLGAGRRHCRGRTTGSAPLHLGQSPDCNFEEPPAVFQQAALHDHGWPAHALSQQVGAEGAQPGMGERQAAGRQADGAPGLGEMRGMRGQESCPCCSDRWENDVSGGRRKEKTWFEEDHAATTRSWSK